MQDRRSHQRRLLDCSVDRSDGIQLLLQLPHFVSGGTKSQIITWPGGRNAGDLLCSVDVDAGAVVMAQDLNGAVTALTQGAGTPLCHPVWTANLPPITVLG